MSGQALRSLDRQGWFVLGATIALVLGLAMSAIMLPHPEVIYLHRGIWHLHLQAIPRQLAYSRYTLSRSSVTTVRFSRRFANKPLSFRPGIWFFGSLKRLPCRL